jgi:hypothetical protein
MTTILVPFICGCGMRIETVATATVWCHVTWLR